MFRSGCTSWCEDSIHQPGQGAAPFYWACSTVSANFYFTGSSPCSSLTAEFQVLRKKQS
ncbi:unnamed protein product, partial [Nesidiocoris tenuis]